ncbi:MAG: hypothetical protein KatS3mg010_1968 [Acidimicrobiia bacterium]|nr:MAG: hypothetical protein KatS3mg010_1968 [Acidimicrobiia bacterium]
MERIRDLLDPQYVASLDRRTLDELRIMKQECADYEHAVSYSRRLAQARIEILEAEQRRRASGGSLEELVAALPEILGAEPGRATATSARLATPEKPAIELRWPDGREELVGDTTLANLPSLDDASLGSSVERLRDFERELSDLRRDLHAVLDAIEREIATRQVAGAG